MWNKKKEMLKSNEPMWITEMYLRSEIIPLFHHTKNDNVNDALHVPSMRFHNIRLTKFSGERIVVNESNNGAFNVGRTPFNSFDFLLLGRTRRRRQHKIHFSFVVYCVTKNERLNKKADGNRNTIVSWHFSILFFPEAFIDFELLTISFDSYKIAQNALLSLSFSVVCQFSCLVTTI